MEFGRIIVVTLGITSSMVVRQMSWLAHLCAPIIWNFEGWQHEPPRLLGVWAIVCKWKPMKLVWWLTYKHQWRKRRNCLGVSMGASPSPSSYLSGLDYVIILFEVWRNNSCISMNPILLEKKVYSRANKKNLTHLLNLTWLNMKLNKFRLGIIMFGI